MCVCICDCVSDCHVYICVYVRVCARTHILGGQPQALDPLELKLQAFVKLQASVSHPAMFWDWNLGRTANALSPAPSCI